jgi:hypothetical protein
MSGYLEIPPLWKNKGRSGGVSDPVTKLRAKPGLFSITEVSIPVSIP